MSASTSSDNLAAAALTRLIGQFSSKYDCFRELVQNSIDAGTQRIDIWTEYEADGAGGGTMIFHVDDDGSGMDQSIIENQLTRLFNSNKEGDLTKIGKFGIGFVSIFALEPQAVLLHTGRAGQYWEVLFHADRSFQLKSLDEPVEGTQLALFVPGTAQDYEQAVDEILKALQHWCRHAETEISFEERSFSRHYFERINEPFAIDGDYEVSLELPGTQIVAAFTKEPSYGFYNRGLALYQGSDAAVALGDRAERLGHVSFKIKSRYLEHTLSRETVVRDENYDKAMDFLEKLVDTELFPRLSAALEQLAPQVADTDKFKQFHSACGYMESAPDSRLLDLLDRPILPTFCDGVLTPRQFAVNPRLAEAGSEAIYLAYFETEQVSAVAQHRIIFRGHNGSSYSRLLLRLARLAIQHHKRGWFSQAQLNTVVPTRTAPPSRGLFFLKECNPSSSAQQLLSKTSHNLQQLGFTAPQLSWVSCDKKKPPEFLSLLSPELARPLRATEQLFERPLALLIESEFAQLLLQLCELDAASAALLLTQRVLIQSSQSEGLAHVVSEKTPWLENNELSSGAAQTPQPERA